MFLVIWILEIIWFIGSISRGVGFSLECHVLHHFLQLVPHHFQFYVYAQKKRFRRSYGKGQLLNYMWSSRGFWPGTRFVLYMAMAAWRLDQSQLPYLCSVLRVHCQHTVYNSYQKGALHITTKRQLCDSISARAAWLSVVPCTNLRNLTTHLQKREYTRLVGLSRVCGFSRHHGHNTRQATWNYLGQHRRQGARSWCTVRLHTKLPWECLGLSRRICKLGGSMYKGK